MGDRLTCRESDKLLGKINICVDTYFILGRCEVSVLEGGML